MLHPMLIRMNEIVPQSRATLLYLRNRIKERMIRKGDFLLKKGDPGNIFIYIKEGCLKEFSIFKNVKFPNLFMEEGYLLFLPVKPGFENIQAIEDTIIYYIDPSDINHLGYIAPNFNGLTMVLLEDLKEEIIDYNYIRKHKTELEKVNWLLERQPKLIDRVPLMDLVIYLQVKLSTLKKMLPGKIEQN